MTRTLENLSFFALGTASWPLVEYGLHGGLFHHGPKTIQATREHLDHHRDPTQNDHEGWTYLEGLKLMAPLVTQYLGYFQAGLTPLMGFRRAAFFNAGLVFGFLLYENVHQSIHRRPPQNWYEEKMWRHHLSHHFNNPKKNHGVTTTIFDHLFGTYEKPGDITIPEHLANRWMKEGLPEGYRLRKSKGAKVKVPAA